MKNNKKPKTRKIEQAEKWKIQKNQKIIQFGKKQKERKNE